MKKRLELPGTLLFYLILSMAIVYPMYKTGFLFNGYDQIFHLSRAHELAIALKQGHFTYGYALNGFNYIGQAVGVFYPSLSVAVLAVIQLLDANLVSSTYLGIFCTVFLGLLISHYSMRKLGKSNLNALIFASMYIGSTMFMQVCFVWFDMGWLWALIFCPLVYSGFVQIFSNHHATITDFTVGISALLLSHVISFLIIMFSLVFIVVVLAFTQREYVFHVRKLLFSGLLGMGCTAFFWARFVRVYLSNTINGVEKIDSSIFALKPSNIVFDSLNNTAITGNIGLIIILVLVAVLAGNNKFDVVDWAALSGALILTFLSSSLFPWVLVQKYLGGIIQYPVRFLSIAVLGFAFVASNFITTKLTQMSNMPRTMILISMGVLLIVMVLGSSTELSGYLNNKDQLRNPSPNVLASPFNKLDLNASKYIFKDNFVMAGETDYWPQQSVKYRQDIRNHWGMVNGKRVRMVPETVKDGLRYKLSLNKGDTVDLPFLNYGDGFKLSSNFQTSKSNRGTLLVKVNRPAGMITVRRANGKIDYIAFAVSLISLLLVFVNVLYGTRFVPRRLRIKRI